MPRGLIAPSMKAPWRLRSSRMTRSDRRVSANVSPSTDKRRLLSRDCRLEYAQLRCPSPVYTEVCRCPTMFLDPSHMTDHGRRSVICQVASARDGRPHRLVFGGKSLRSKGGRQRAAHPENRDPTRLQGGGGGWASFGAHRFGRNGMGNRTRSSSAYASYCGLVLTTSTTPPRRVSRLRDRRQRWSVRLASARKPASSSDR